MSADVISLDEARAARTPEPWIGKKDLAHYLNCHPRTIERYLNDPRYTIGGKNVPHRRIFGGPVQFKISHVEKWLQGVSRS